MAPFIDPEINHLMTQFYDSDHDKKFLYRGSQEKIVKELHAWVVHRQELSQEEQELREKIFEANLEFESAMTTTQRDVIMTKGDRHSNRAKVSNVIWRALMLEFAHVYCQAIEIEENEDTARAKYLLASLRQQGVLWPKLWWRTDCDGAVCSFLGTVDPTFDPDLILLRLQDVGRGDRFEAKKAEIEAREKKKLRERPFVSAMNTDPAKWARIVKAVDSGDYPDFRIWEAKLQPLGNDGAESALRLRDLLDEVSKDMQDDSVQPQTSD